MLSTAKIKAKTAWKYVNYKRGAIHVPHFPDRMYIEATNVCNLDCVMCPTGLKLMGRKKGFIDFDMFKMIMDEMGPHVPVTTLHIWGEPLLHPKLIEMINYGKQFPIKIEISTNATLLTEEKARALLDTKLDTIYLCMDGMTKETYEKIRRGGTFEKTMENIERFIRLKSELKGEGKPWVNLQLVEMKPTKEEAELFRQHWTRPGVNQVKIKAFDAWGSQVDEITELKPEVHEDIPDRFHCPNLWYHAHIYWDGTLVCCDRDFDTKWPLDNVKDGVMAAWNGPKMKDLRRRHMCNKLDEVTPCTNCTEWAWWKPTPFSSKGNTPRD